MDEVKLKDYLDSIEHEIRRLDNKEFVGNIQFRLNMKYGRIVNMNIDLSKSVKFDDEVSLAIGK